MSTQWGRTTRTIKGMSLWVAHVDGKKVYALSDRTPSAETITYATKAEAIKAL